MMGERQVDQSALFYEFSLEKHVPADHMLRAIDRFVDLGDVRTHLAPFYSTTGRPSVDPGAADPDADHRLLLRHPLGTPAVRGGPSEPGLSVVLSARPGGRGAGSFDLLEEPPWPLPRERSSAAGVRDGAAPLHRRGVSSAATALRSTAA